ncbi:MAG: hypothetical protein JW384_03544 [Nitrosomonadaceae bacterium]|nr:hypothetical protein [Nitrosomonadaceae bacterium]
MKGMSESAGALPSTAWSSPPFTFTSLVPPLLHVYWALQAIHLILGALALRSWWKGFALKPQLPTSTGALGTAVTYSLPATRYSLLWPLASWACLALLFYIPGIYLEWPSDPWEHLRRINEWRVLDTVTAHSSWIKSSYFIPYSLLSWATGLRQIFWLDFYYTGICLLLCWQYYRLARACDLDERASMGFVILQTLLFGNSVFSFYRYYGISSNIYAQLGAVALTRIVLDFASRGKKLKVKNSRLFFERVSDASKTNYLSPTYHPPVEQPTYCSLLISSTLLFTLIAFNHFQGLGITALGIAAIAICQLIRWKPSAGWGLLAGVVLLSLVIIKWYPRHPAIDDLYMRVGWLSRWYGFNILSIESYAGVRMLQVVGTMGVLNLVGGLLLLRWNHIIGWLTVMPIVALCLPCIAIPFADRLIQHGNVDTIVSINRMFFAIPTGLAIVCLVSNPIPGLAGRFYKVPIQLILSFVLILGGLVFLTAVSSDRLHYQRFWQALAQTPSDLRVNHIIAASNSWSIPQVGNESPKLLTTSCINFIFRATAVLDVGDVSRITTAPMTDSVTAVISSIGEKKMTQSSFSDRVLFIPSTRELYTPFSFAGQLSMHWTSSQVALTNMASLELKSAALKEGISAQIGVSSNFYQRPKQNVPSGKQTWKPFNDPENQ